MGKFDEIRRIMKDFKGDVDGLANRKIEEIETAKARLNPTALKEELASLDAEYGKHFEFTRNMYREKLAAAVADRRRRNANKYIKGYFDFDLLNKMNIIRQSEVQLTEDELASFCKDAMKSRSEFCVRKVQLMAEQNGFRLNVPSEAKANAVLMSPPIWPPFPATIISTVSFLKSKDFAFKFSILIHLLNMLSHLLQ